jgi:predicted nucleic acid-binding protein
MLFVLLDPDRIIPCLTYRRALELWVNTPAVRDFVDALSMAHAERLKIPTDASFDTDFDRFPTIKHFKL